MTADDQKKLFAEAMKGKKLFAEILQKELNKVFEKHIEDLKSAYVSIEVGVEDVRKDTIGPSSR